MTIGDSIDETIVAYRPLYSDTTIATGREYYYRVIAHGNGGDSPPSETDGPVAITHHTLVDELLPGREKFSATMGTAFTDQKSWRFKYDFHRRKGSRDDYLEYTVDGAVDSVRIFAFFPKKFSSFRVEISTDGKRYLPAEVRSLPFPYCCADPRDRLRLPVLFIAGSPIPKGNRVRIIFPGGGAQAGRCEIDYR